MGELETAVMRHLWSCGPEGCSAAEVQNALKNERSLALTTILTTLDRLVEKGIVRREEGKRPYRFSPGLSEDQLERRIVESILGGLIAQFPKAVATYFTQKGFADADMRHETVEALEQLAARIEAMDSPPPSESHDDAPPDSGVNEHDPLSG